LPTTAASIFAYIASEALARKKAYTTFPLAGFSTALYYLAISTLLITIVTNDKSIRACGCTNVRAEDNCCC
jgi:hypothetical protein